MVKINSVQIEGSLNLTLVGYDPEFIHSSRCQQIRNQRPDIDLTQLRRLNEPLKLTISVHGWEDFTIQYRAGFVFDTASVPAAVKFAIDNDSAEMLIPSLYHDAAFALHWFPFKKTNQIFRGLVKYYGKKYHVKFAGLRALLAYVGVNSFVGRRIYHNTICTRHFNYGYADILPQVDGYEG